MLYKEFGFANTEEMFKKAIAGAYAIPAYNFSNMEQIQAVVEACVRTQSPVILQVSAGARKYAGEEMLMHMAKGGVEMGKALAKKLGLKEIPIALHLDHGADYDICKACIDSGFSSIMIDGSHLPYDENVALTKRVVECAHKCGVSVEGELGILAGIEDDVMAEKSSYTKPEEVEDFVKKTGVDSLAISIGTSHGAHKFKVDSVDQIPPLRFDILEEIEKRIPGFPIVLHGSSSIPQWSVEMINEYGGKVENAFGIPESQLRRAAQSAVCKINIDSDCRLVMTGAVRKALVENPSNFDPRKYIGAARDALVEMLIHKNKEVLGSSDRV